MTTNERLSALDASFLGIENDHAPMHVGAVMVLEAGPLARDDGGIHFDRLVRYFESTMQTLPRFRQRLSWVPGLRHPTWIDDEHFNIYHHVRHVALPRPGDERTLKRLAGRIFSQSLDRSRPLWEFWVVEGLDRGRFAMITKLHHCMIDGVAGANLMATVMRGTPDESIPDVEPWQPRPAPNGAEMLANELGHRARSLRGIFDRARAAVQQPDWWGRARETLGGAATTLGAGLVPASATPLNPRAISPNRRFDVCSFDLQEVKDVKNALGGTLNDVVLATAAGALSRFLRRRGTNIERLVDYRALIPVNIRGSAGGTQNAGNNTGNKVAMMLAELPISEPDPKKRLAKITEVTRYLKTESKQVESSELFEQVSEAGATSLVQQIFAVASRQRAFNIVITNVPGPPFPLYLLGARVQSVFPLVPLFGTQGAGLALFSYCGRLHWGLTADWQLVPDLHDLCGDLHHAFAELKTAASMNCEPKMGKLQASAPAP